ncbi:MAG: gliding motility-associated C-terminal domain-containing protein [Brumimicrobium sp.]|nr:gliding motility-associated C-terminal domain-containing protein [Brumimicrobium sp.]
MFRKALLLALTIIFSLNLHAQRAILGNYTVPAQNTWVNTYAFLTANANAGATLLAVNSNSMSGTVFSGNLSAGDLILIVQMQGASVDVNHTPTSSWGGNYTVQNSWMSTFFRDSTEYGQVLNYNNAGNFEYAEVAGVSGSGGITLSCPLSKSYTASGHVQVVRVPRFDNLTVPNNTSITAPFWNGSTGGIVAIEVDGDLIINGTGTISASELGFRGGVIDGTSTQSASASSDNGHYGSFDLVEGAEKGEGIYGFYTEYDNIYSRFCRGAIANGGGGANYHNAGGGGGANVGSGTYYAWGVADPGPSNSYVAAWNLEDPGIIANPSSGGGRGGYSHAITNNNPLTLGPNEGAWNGDYRRAAGGFGGHPLTYDPGRIFMGGGGGAGDNNNGYGGDGGKGGGLVMLKIYGSVSGTGSIRANGQNGENATGPTPGNFSTALTGDDGAGGAGGGGAIHISNANPLPAGITLSARGGNGGNQNLQFGGFATTNQADGPGAGGAGGMISFTSGTPTQNVNGGIAGTTNSSYVSNFPINGATGGGVGMSDLVNDFYDLITANDTVCGGGSTTLTVTVIGTLPGGAGVEWFDAPFGGNNVGSGINFTTPSLSSTTTYYVGVCPGSFRVPVTVIVSPAINISGLPPTITDETCSGNDGSITGLSASGGFGSLSYSWNGNSTPTADLVNAIGGNYTLTVTDQNGCTETSGPFTISPSPGPSIDLSNLTITDESCLGNDGSITGIIATGSNIVIEWNGVVEPDEDITGLSGGTYTLVVTDDASCTSTAGPFTVNSDPGPVIDDTNVSLSDETCFGNDGSITGISVTGTNLTYEWNGIETLSADTVGLGSGNYLLTVTDGVGCSASSGPYTINEIPGPSIDDSNITISDEGCNQGNGSITGITATGNNLSFVWNGTVQPQIDLNNLSGGSYTLEVVDDLGCTATSGPYIVQNVPAPVIDASNVIIEDETCNGNDGGIYGLTATGNGLNFQWNSVSSPTIDLTGAAAGNYVLEVTDENGCTTTEGPFVIGTVPPPTLDDANLSVQDETCAGNDGSIAGLSATGSNLTYEWNGQVSPTLNISNLTQGNYNLVITDDNGCSINYGPIAVGGFVIPTVSISPGNTSIDLGQSVDLNATITPVGANVFWSPTDGLSCAMCLDPTATPEMTTWYVITVISSDGCQVKDSVLIEIIDPCGETLLPTVFSPNGDGLNDNLCVLGGCLQSVNLEIFNRWGERIFQTNNPDDCWNGTFNGEPVNTGTYIYKLNGVKLDGTDFSLAGNVNVVR